MRNCADSSSSSSSSIGPHTLSRGLDILNYHFIYIMPASFLSDAGSHFWFGNNVILLLVDFVYRGRAQNVIKVT